MMPTPAHCLALQTESGVLTTGPCSGPHRSPPRTPTPPRALAQLRGPLCPVGTCCVRFRPRPSHPRGLPPGTLLRSAPGCLGLGVTSLPWRCRTWPSHQKGPPPATCHHTTLFPCLRRKRILLILFARALFPHPNMTSWRETLSTLVPRTKSGIQQALSNRTE